MDEIKWLTCRDPLQMLRWLGVPAESRRGLLVSASCCRRHWHLLTDAGHSFVECIERRAEGLPVEVNDEAGVEALTSVRDTLPPLEANALDAAILMMCAVWEAPDVQFERELQAEASKQTELLR